MMAISQGSKFRIGALFATLILTAFIAPLCAGDQVSKDCESYDRHARAGWPQCVAPWARASFGPYESGGYIGGGAPFHGDCRCGHEGTWGWDYNGRLFNKHIWLGWHHGRRNQGGTGAYKSDGPHFPHH